MWPTERIDGIAFALASRQEIMVADVEGITTANIIYSLWALRNEACEEFDRFVCRTRSMQGVAIPVTSDERRACDRHARVQRVLLNLRAAQLAIPATVLREGRHHQWDEHSSPRHRSAATKSQP